MAATTNVQAIITAQDRASGVLANFGSNIGALGGKAKFAAGGVAAVGVATAIAVKTAIDFESSFAGVRKTVDASEAEFQQLAQNFRDIAKEAPITTDELNRIGELAGQLGVRGVNNITKFTKTIADLSVTTNLTSEEASTSFARIANIMQEPIKNVDKMGSSVVDLGNNFATTEREISDFANRIAGAGKTAGLTTSDIFGISAAFSSVGVQAERGGTAVSKTLFAMANAAKNGGEKLEQFAEVAGISSDKFVKVFEQDAAKAFNLFVEGLAKNGIKATGLLEELELSDQRLMQSFISVAGAGGIMNEAIEKSSQAWDKNTALTEEAEKRYKTTASQLQILKNNVMDVLLTIGNLLLPVVNEVIKEFKGWVESIASVVDFMSKDLPEAIKNGVDKSKELIEDLREKWDSTWETMSGKVEKTKPQIEGRIDGIKEKLRSSLESMQQKVNNFTLEGFLEGLDKANEFLSTYIEDTLTKWGEWGEEVKANAEEALNGVVNFFSELPSKVGEELISFKDTVIQKFNETKTNILDFVKTSRENVTRFFSELPGKIGQALTNAIDNIKEFFTNLPSNILGSTDKAGEDTVKNLTDSAKKKLTSIETIRKVGDALAQLAILAVGAAMVYIVDGGFRAAKGLIRGWNNFKASARRQISEWLSSVFAAIGNFFKGVGSWLYDSGRALIQGFVNGIKSAAPSIGRNLRSSVLNQIPGGQAFDIARKTLGFQTGTSFAPGGMSLVGERGPELVSLPRGSKVRPNDKTEKVMRNNQPNVNITIQAGAFMGSQQDARKYAEMIFRAYADLIKANPSKAVI